MDIKTDYCNSIALSLAKARSHDDILELLKQSRLDEYEILYCLSTAILINGIALDYVSDTFGIKDADQQEILSQNFFKDV